MKRIALFFICFLLCGCAKNNPVREIPEAEEKTVEVSVSKNYGSVIEDNRDYFIGADITGDTNVEDIVDFEEMTAAHDIYAEEVYIDEANFAENFILECFALGKTPYIIIKNKDSIGEDSFKEYADLMAEAVGKYNIEVMVEILENSYYYDENGDRYNYLYDALKESNELVKSVWSVKSDDIILAEKYMPDTADYICVNGYFADEAEAERMFSEMRNHLDAGKGVIIRFGAASYSSSDCVYRLDEAVSTIAEVYDKAKKDNSIAGIIYMDKNEKLSDKVVYTDYSVTSDKKVREGYKQIVEEAAAYRMGDD